MNKKKLIFLIVLWVLVLIIIWTIISLWNSKKTNKINTKNKFTIWIYNIEKEDFQSFIDDFKKEKNIKNFSPEIISFHNYQEYSMALASAIIKEEAPDLYMINNNEKSIFLENAIWINPARISPDSLREYFYSFFGDDLISTVKDWDKNVEFILWVPFWFETLWLYYNIRRVFDVNKIKTFPKIENFIWDFSQKHPWKIAISLWKWKTIKYSWDILAQFLLGTWKKSIKDLSQIDLKKALSNYFLYASWDNNYNNLDIQLKKDKQNNIDAFVSGNLAMMIGYPRMIFDIDKRWFDRRRLWVIPFPDFIDNSDKLVNYNFFVVSKNSKNKELAYLIMDYLFSENWEKSLLKNIKYYIPARISLYSDFKDNRILNNFNVKLKNFYSTEANYYSFDKWIKTIFDEKIPYYLENQNSYLDTFTKFINKLKCITYKIIKLDKLDKICE